MGKRLRKEFKEKLDKEIKLDNALIEYIDKLPEGLKFDKDIGEFKDFNLLKEININDVKIVILKDLENKDITKILSIKEDNDNEKNELSEIATIKDGKLILEPNLKKSLEIYDKESLDLLLDSEKVDIVKNNDNKIKLEDEKNVIEKQDVEKENVAKSIEESPYDILNIVNFHDVDVATKLFNSKKMEKGSKISLVRLRNNKFKLLEKTSDGKYSEIKGYEATPVGKELFPVVSSQFNYTQEVRIGEIRAGKTNEELRRYDFFQIKGKGDQEEGNSLFYIGVNDNSRVDMINNIDEGYEFERIKDLDNVYPRQVIVNGKTKLIKTKEEEEIAESLKDNNDQNIEYQSNDEYKGYLNDKIRLERELVAIDKKLEILYEDSNENAQEIYDLEERREEIFDELGVNKEKYLEEELNREHRRDLRK